jgi:uncharacterized protein (DUF2225 family)
MKHLLRKTFNVEIIIPKRISMFHWKKKIELTIRQATILETIQYIDKQEGKEDFLFYLVALLEKFYGKNFTKDERMYLFTKKKELTEIIKDTYLYNVVDIEEKIPSV